MHETTKRFWDCNCKTDYIRLAGEGSCGICYACEQDMPDSHVNEVPTSDLESAKQELMDDLRIIISELKRRGADLQTIANV